jgi:hypothetical protein
MLVTTPTDAAVIKLQPGLAKHAEVSSRAQASRVDRCLNCIKARQKSFKTCRSQRHEPLAGFAAKPFDHQGCEWLTQSIGDAAIAGLTFAAFIAIAFSVVRSSKTLP